MKPTICVVTADAARARWFTVTRAPGAAGQLETRLHEVKDMVNSGQRILAHETFSDPRPGLQREFSGAASHGVDDHRNRHKREDARRFAADIVATTHALVKDFPCERLIAAASPKMLGHLREEGLHAIASDELEIDDIPRDLTRLSSRELEEYFEDQGLLG